MTDADRKAALQQAQDHFNSWAKAPDFVPLDEDLALNLIARLQSIYLAGLAKGRADERERCASFIDKFDLSVNGVTFSLERLSAAIRAIPCGPNEVNENG